jgi:hypothetical protein
MSSKYSLIFEAVDRASGVINQIDSKTGSLFNKIGNVGSSFAGMGAKGALALTALVGGLAAVGAAFTAVNAGADFFVSKLQEAASIEIGNKIATISLSTDLGKSLQEIEGAYKQLESRINKAEARTGIEQTDLSRRLFDNILKATKGDVNRSVELTGGTTGALSLATQGMDQSMVKQYAEKLFTVDFTQLKNIDVLTPFMTSIEGFLEKQGKTAKDFNKMTAQQRAELFNEYSKLSLDPKNIAYLNASFQVKFNKMVGDVFSVDRGFLGGFNKVLEGRGNRKIIDAASDVLTELFEVFSEIGTIFSGQGFNGDTVLNAIYDNLQRFAEFLQTIQDNLSQNREVYGRALKYASELIDFMFKLGGFFFNFDMLVVKSFGMIVGALYSGINDMINYWNTLPEKIQSLGSFLYELVTNWINNMMDAGKKAFNRALGIPEDDTKANQNQTTQPAQTGNFLSNFFFGNATIPILGGAKYTGQIPLKNLDLMRQESNFNPNQRQVLASENEYILTPNQMKNLISNISQNASQTFNVTVNAGLGAREIADTVVSTIKSEWDNTKLAMFDLADMDNLTAIE